MADSEVVVAAYKRWKEVLWPLGGTLLGLVAMPVAIAQYPNFFNENQWLLPLCVVAVLACWVVPLLIHENAKRFLGHVWSKGKPGKLVAIVLVLACLMVAGLGSRKLFVFHTAHLKKAFPLKTTEIESANPTEPAAQPPHDAAREATANPPAPNESTKNKEKELPPPKLKSPNLLTKEKAIELADRIQRIGNDLSRRIEQITDDYAQKERGLPEEEVRQHYEPFKALDMQQARDRATKAYDECCRGKAQEFREQFGDVTDSRMESDFNSPFNSMGYGRVAADLRKLATLAATTDRPNVHSTPQGNSAPYGIAIGHDNNGTAIVNNGPPPPRLVSTNELDTANKDGTYTATCILQIESETAPGHIVLQITTEGLQRVMLMPHPESNQGGSTMALNDVRQSDSFYRATINGPSGRYDL